MVARLFDGSVSHIDERTGISRSAGFEVTEIPINLKPPPDFRFRGLDPRGVTLEREMTLPELLRTAFDPATAPLIKHQAEAGLYRRAAQTLVLFLLPLLALPLARPPLRTVSSTGVVVGIALFIIYNELSLFGERLGASGQVAPLAAQAPSFLCFAAVSLGLYLTYALRPGEPALSQLSALCARTFRKAAPAPLLAPAE
jgi:lipopolysaccharide export system permease protein